MSRLNAVLIHGTTSVAQLVRVLPRMRGSWVQVPPEAANFSLKNDCFNWASCVVLLCLSIVLCCLAICLGLPGTLPGCPMSPI